MRNRGVRGKPTGNTSLSNYIYDVLFPYYLSIGMSADDFLHGDTALFKVYREADKIRQNRDNQKLWLQGAYIYEALLRVAPLYNPFNDGSVTVIPYLDEPYPLTKEEQEAQKKRKQFAEMAIIQEQLRAFAVGFNTQLAKGGDNNATG